MSRCQHIGSQTAAGARRPGAAAAAAGTAAAVSHLCLLRPVAYGVISALPTRAAAAMRSLPSSHSEGCCLLFTVMS